VSKNWQKTIGMTFVNGRSLWSLSGSKRGNRSDRSALIISKSKYSRWARRTSHVFNTSITLYLCSSIPSRRLYWRSESARWFFMLECW